MGFSVVCILTKRVRDITVVKMMWTNFDHCEDGYSLSVRVQTTLNHIRFVTPHVSLRAQAEKALRDTLTRAAWYGLLLRTPN